MPRIASRIDADGLLNFPIEEITDAEMGAILKHKKEMKDLVGVPLYYSKKRGYFPKPGDGWTIHVLTIK